jgi:hypothetical protein
MTSILLGRFVLARTLSVSATEVGHQKSEGRWLETQRPIGAATSDDCG